MSLRSPTPAGLADACTNRRTRTEARATIDRGATEIARHPDRWEPLVFATRAKLGLGPLPVSVDLSKARFVRYEVSGQYGIVPLERPIRLGGSAINEVLETREPFYERSVILRTPAKEDDFNSAAVVSWRNERMEAVQAHLRDLPHHPIVPRLLLTGELLLGKGETERCEIYERAPGLSLRRFTSEHGLSLGEVVDILWHVTRGLDHLQRHGLVHGDIKPENFCVERKPKKQGGHQLVVRLIDFDTVSSFDELLDEVKIGSMLCGTLHYMSPEVFQQEVPEDPKDALRMAGSKDVYALGLSLTRMLLGQFPDPLNGLDNTEVYEMKRDAVELTVEFPPEVPEDLQTLLRSMVSAHWRDRPTIAEAKQRTGALRTKLSDAERTARLVDAGTHHWPSLAGELRAPLGRIGPFEIVQYVYKVRDDGSILSKLRDSLGRPLIGVPFTFSNPEEADAFYAERSALLADLNQLRAKHPGLFPGTFRDLVREEVETPGKAWRIWLVRPFLPAVQHLRSYVETLDPKNARAEKYHILQRIAESLAALEEAKYRHPGVTGDNVFFVPILSGKNTGMNPPPSIRHRQELMEMASVRKVKPGDTTRDRTIDDVERLALEDLDLGAIPGWHETTGWTERAALLRSLAEREERLP